MAQHTETRDVTEFPARIPVNGSRIEGVLRVPFNAVGVIAFAQGADAGRAGPSNRSMAAALARAQLGTLLVDLADRREDEITEAFRLDLDLLAARLVAAVDWLGVAPQTRALPIGLYGSSAGAAAALVAASLRPHVVRALVARAGRPDLAGSALVRVETPTLLIVAARDPDTVEMNRLALGRLAAATKELRLVPRATSLFEETGALDEVARLTVAWFARHLPR